MFSLKTIPGKVAAYIAGLMLAAYWVAAGAQRNWGVTIPTALHTYGIRNRRGADLFFRPAVGWFIEHGFWVVLGAVLVTAIVEIAARQLTTPTSSSSEDHSLHL